MDYAVQALTAGQVPDVTQMVNSTAGALERGGLYTVTAILLLFVIYLFVSREKLQAELVRLITSMVEKQTQALTENTLVNNKIESLLAQRAVLDAKIEEALRNPRGSRRDS